MFKKAISLLSIVLICCSFCSMPIKIKALVTPEFNCVVNYNGNTVTVTGYNGSDSTIVIPAEIDGYKVTGVSFSKDAIIPNVVLPDTIEYIENNAFNNCLSLQEISIPDTVSGIGNYSFAGCINLRKANLPKSLYSLGEGAFSNCINLEMDVVIPESIEYLRPSIFSNCRKLKSIYIHKRVFDINSAFLGCTNAKSIVVDPDNTYYDSRNKCNAIIKKDGNTLLLGSSSTVIPDSVEKIGFKAFSGCEASQINIPSSIQSIGSYAFSDCPYIETISIPNSIKTIESYTFSNCTNLNSIIIPESVKRIGNYAFINCNNLKSVMIPSSVISIGENAFGFLQSDETLYDSETHMQRKADAVYLDSFKICCYKQTAGESYARRNALRYVTATESLELTTVSLPEQICRGDSNADGEIDITDATVIQRNIVSIPVVLYADFAADVDNDGQTTIIDTTAIQYYLVKMGNPYRIGESI